MNGLEAKRLSLYHPKSQVTFNLEYVHCLSPNQKLVFEKLLQSYMFKFEVWWIMEANTIKKKVS